MPLPKNIYHDPATRTRWVVERRATLESFERLTAKGLTKRQAAARLGVSPAGIRAMRASVEGLENGTRNAGAAKVARIDLGLALLSVLRRPGEALTVGDIAAWCDCSHQAITRIEQRALAKVRRKLVEMEARDLAKEEAAEALARLPQAA